MYVILTSKPRKYVTQPNEDTELIEGWEYRLYGELQAQFKIARLLRETRVNVVELDDTSIVNRVPSKFLERFDTLEQAHAELQTLCNFGTLDAKLVSIPAQQPLAT